MEEIENLWSMPPNPAFGCCVDDRYLVVSDAGTVDGPYKGFFSIVDLETGAHDMFVSAYQTPVHDIVAMNGYAWIWRQTTVNVFDWHILQRITPSTGGVENIPTSLVRAAAPLMPDPSRSYLYGYSPTGTTASTSRGFAFDTVNGEVNSINSGTHWSGIRYFDPDLDKVGLIHQSTLRLYNPDDLNEAPIEHATTGSIPAMTFVRTKTEYRDGLVSGLTGSSRVLFDTEELEASVYYGIPGVSGNLGDDGKWYTSTSSVVEAFDTKLKSFNTTTLTSRGNRGTAIPVGDRLYVPAGTRP